MLQKIFDYFRDGLWNFRLNDLNPKKRFFLKHLRICTLSIKGFIQNKCPLRASGLTYYTLMSLVPILAMCFAVAKGFGYHELLKSELLIRFKDQRIVLNELFAFTEKLLTPANEGWIAAVGLIILFWSVALLLNNMEEAFNQIWGIKKSRSWRRVLSDYFSLMLIGPFFFVLSSSMTVFVVGHLEKAIHALPIGQLAIGSILFMTRLIPYCLFWFLFTYVYLFIPNTKVRFSSAFFGGVVAGTLYVIVQWGYIYFQVGVNRYGAIYGSFAALPLFLIWLQLSWILLLLGGEISYSHQTLDEHEYEGISKRVSLGFKRILSLYIIHLAVLRFKSHAKPISLEALIFEYKIPHALAAALTNELIECRILVETKEGLFPARPIDRLKISDVLQALDQHGITDFPHIDSLSLAPFEKAMDDFRKLIENSPLNELISHVPHPI